MVISMQYLIIALVIVVLIFISMYNSLVSLKKQVENSFGGIDVQLKRRTDLIPNLVNTVKGYASHEKELLENVTKARASIVNGSANHDIKEIAAGENMLTGALKSVFAVSENYPDLKANQNFIDLQNQLTETEDQIAAARRIYNENVTYYNTKLEVIPTNFIAKMFNFKPEDLFEATETERKNVEVKF